MRAPIFDALTFANKIILKIRFMDQNMKIHASIKLMTSFDNVH